MEPEEDFGDEDESVLYLVDELRRQHQENEKLRTASSSQSRRSKQRRGDETDSDEESFSSSKREYKVPEMAFERLPRLSEGRLGTWRRHKGMSIEGVEEVKPSSRLYRHVVPNRTYRLRWKRRTDVLSALSVKRNLQKLQLYAKKLYFDGIDPVCFIEFLTSYTKKCDELHLSENEAYIAVSFFLSGRAEALFQKPSRLLQIPRTQWEIVLRRPLIC